MTNQQASKPIEWTDTDGTWLTLLKANDPKGELLFGQATASDIVAALRANEEAREAARVALLPMADARQEATERRAEAAETSLADYRSALESEKRATGHLSRQLTEALTRAEDAEDDLDFLANHMSTDWTNQTDAGGKAMLRMQSAEAKVKELEARVQEEDARMNLADERLRRVATLGQMRTRAEALENRVIGLEVYVVDLQAELDQAGAKVAQLTQERDDYRVGAREEARRCDELLVERNRARNETLAALEQVSSLQAQLRDLSGDDCSPGFGINPGDSAALLSLREAIDAANIWPSEAAKEAGEYEAAVAYMAAQLREREEELAACERAAENKTSVYVVHSSGGHPVDVRLSKEEAEGAVSHEGETVHRYEVAAQPPRVDGPVQTSPFRQVAEASTRCAAWVTKGNQRERCALRDGHHGRCQAVPISSPSVGSTREDERLKPFGSGTKRSSQRSAAHRRRMRDAHLPMRSRR